MDEQTIYHLSQDKLVDEEGMTLTANDPDANHYQSEVDGEEAVGGLTPTPEQNIVEDIAVAVGVQTDDNKPLRVRDQLEQRDEQRWELDSDSAEDR